MENLNKKPQARHFPTERALAEHCASHNMQEARRENIHQTKTRALTHCPRGAQKIKEKRGRESETFRHGPPQISIWSHTNGQVVQACRG